MKKIHYLLIVTIGVLSVFLFASFAKENIPVNPIVKVWTLQSKTVAGVTVATTCDPNSKWDFKADGTYVITDNCDSIESGAWKLSDDAKIITLDGVTAYNVVESSVGSLVIETKVVEIGLIRWSFN